MTEIATTQTTTPHTPAPASGVFIEPRIGAAPLAVSAVQWQHDEDSLRRVQALIFPGSPLLETPGAEGDGGGPGASEKSTTLRRSLGVMCTNDEPWIYVRLQFAQPGDWVVKHDSGRIEIVAAAMFVSRFSPAVFVDPRD